MEELGGRLVIPGNQCGSEIPCTEHKQGLLLAHTGPRGTAGSAPQVTQGPSMMEAVALEPMASKVTRRREIKEKENCVQGLIRSRGGAGVRA